MAKPAGDAGMAGTITLVRRAQAGDVTAFACIAEQQQAALWRFCLRLTRNHQAAQDLAQETLLRAFQAIGRLEEPHRFAAWLFGIAANVARKWWHQQARWPASLDALIAAYPDVPWDGLLSSEATPEQAFEAADQTRRLQEAIDSLPTPLGRVLALHYLDGLSYAEIAAALDVPVSTVKGRLFKSRVRLAGSLVALGVLSPARNRHVPAVAKAPRGGSVLMASSVSQPEARLVPVQVESIRMNHEQPTLAGVLRWLQRLPRRERGSSDEGPILAPLAEQFAPQLDEAGLELVSPLARMLLLKEVDGQRVLPIVIGIPEADALALHLQGHQLPRPLSHDLTGHLLDAGGARIERAAITRHDEGTFYASITLRRSRGKLLEIDARPSDAINLAVRAGAPLYVAEEVLASAGVAPAESSQSWSRSLDLSAIKRTAGWPWPESGVGGSGVLEVVQSYGFLRRDAGLEPHPEDAYVPAALVQRYSLRTGDTIAGVMLPPVGREKYHLLDRVDAVNGQDPEEVQRQRKPDSAYPALE
jgi:RNA polymerase sigma factor (sigma-70 family)